MFNEQLQAAKAVVQEPPQPKIKIKMTPGQEAPAVPKKITIHVANTRGSSAESPAPATGGSVSSEGGTNDRGSIRNPPNGQNSAPPANMGQLDKTRGASVASPSPSTGLKREDVVGASPAVIPRPNGPTSAVPSPHNGPPPSSAILPNGHGQVAPNPGLPYETKFRFPGRGKCLSSLVPLSFPILLNKPQVLTMWQSP